jgi:hypothetical protein
MSSSNATSFSGGTPIPLAWHGAFGHVGIIAMLAIEGPINEESIEYALD